MTEALSYAKLPKEVVSQGDESDRATPSSKAVRFITDGALQSTTFRARVRYRPRARFVSRLRDGDEIARLITFLFAGSVVLITVLLVYELWAGSVLPRHKFGFGFLVTRVWDPSHRSLRRAAVYLRHAGHRLRVAAHRGPLGIGAAIFLAELAPRESPTPSQFFIELLAAVPSVIYGLLGVFILVPLMREYIQPALKNTLGFLPLFQGPAYGVGFLTAGIVLAIMIVPYIISVSREVLLSVPRDQREAALALGSTRWESTWKVVVPFARTGIMGSIFLALARALGETMAVTMVIGNTPTISASLFSPGYSIAAVIANEFTEATGDLYLQSLIELGLVLFLLTFILNGLARLLIVVTSSAAAEWGTHEPPSPLAQIRQRFHADHDRPLRLRRRSVLFFILGYSSITAARPSIGTSSPSCPLRWAKPAAAWPTPSWAAPRCCFSPRLFGVPIGFFGGVYLAEFSGSTVAFVVRYAADLAERRALHRDRDFRLYPGGAAVQAFLDAGWRLRPWHDDDSDHLAQHRRISARRAARLARRRHGSGRQQVEDDLIGRGSRGVSRHPDGRAACLRARGRRNRAAAVHRFRQSLLESWLEPAHRFAAGHDLHLCHRAV